VQARLEGSEKAVELREEAVSPLRAEVQRMRAALADLQVTFSSDVSQVPHHAPLHRCSTRQPSSHRLHACILLKRSGGGGPFS